MKWWIRIKIGKNPPYIQVWPRDFRFWIRYKYWNERFPKRSWDWRKVPKSKI